MAEGSLFFNKILHITAIAECEELYIITLFIFFGFGAQKLTFC
jgi:hypothetical protein